MLRKQLPGLHPRAIKSKSLEIQPGIFFLTGASFDSYTSYEFTGLSIELIINLEPMALVAVIRADVYRVTPRNTASFRGIYRHLMMLH